MHEWPTVRMELIIPLSKLAHCDANYNESIFKKSVLTLADARDI